MCVWWRGGLLVADFLCGWDGGVCVCGVNGVFRPHSPHVVTSRVVVSSSVAGSVVLMVLAVAVVLVV